MRDEGRNAPEIKAHREVWPFLIYCVKVDDLLTVNDREKAVGGRWGEPDVNNLVYTKRRKDIYANKKHETTFHFIFVGCWLFLQRSSTVFLYLT